MGVRRVVGVVVALGVIAPASAAAYPNPGVVAGSTALVHDPSMLVRPDQPRYVVYATHNQTRVSGDRVAFADSGPPFVVKPEWWNAYNNGDGSMWAPDASFHGGKYWLYYSVSTFGSQRSAIGLATSPSGLPGTWTDQGTVITSKPGDPYNAIDPNLLVDANGNWSLVFGSYWGGIYSTPLSKTTGKPTSSPPSATQLASRNGGAIEGAVVYRKGGWYYLFASFDRCCNGVSSNYKIRVGRSASPTGPYVDQAGVPMTSGGGTLVLSSHNHVIGPGGQSVLWDPTDNHDLLVYHYYDSRLNGQPFLGINFLGWTADGWPYVW